MAKSIAVAGKGGTGKSTITALVIQQLVELNSGPVLAIDADPDANLGTLLGIEVEQTIGGLREDLLKDIKNFPAGMSKANYIEAGLHRIISESKGLDLVTMGKGEGASCYCYLNNLIRKFCDDLCPSYSWVVMDNEAGLEHISRRTTTDIDALLVVVTDNPLSFDCALRIEDITRDIKSLIREKYIITNMVREDVKETVFKRIEELPMTHLCDIPYSSGLNTLIFNGEPVSKLENTTVRDSILKIINKIGG